MIFSRYDSAPAAARPGCFSVAPMIDLTDRHCRYFLRLISARVDLYTEMITTTAIRHGDLDRVLGFDAAEQPLALQLGGSDPGELAASARIGESLGYGEINLNCGCPSDRVLQGAFGACLMTRPAAVAEMVASICDAVSVPVTVKHRIGLGRDEDYGFVRDFVGQVARAGCSSFIVHARNAWLEGLSPKENRSIPPLRYEVVYRLAADFPELRFVLNGGLRDHDQIAQAGSGLAGVMLGRAVYENPWLLAQCDSRYYGEPERELSRADVACAMRRYADRMCATGTPLRAITRHMLGLYNGLPGARRWRRMLSDASLLRVNDASLIERALAAVEAQAVLDRAA